MKVRYRIVGLLLFVCFLVSCTERSPFVYPKVPHDQLIAAQALVNPFPQSPEILAEGEVLYKGKGICIHCHGVYGDGNGPGAVKFNTPPRNFRESDFWEHRTQGELFWVVKNGSPHTGMLEFESLLSDEEIWKILRYIQIFPSGPHPPKVKDNEQ